MEPDRHLNPRRPSSFQPPHRSRARRELVDLDAQALEHGDEQVRQRIVVRFVEGEVLAVLEAAVTTILILFEIASAHPRESCIQSPVALEIRSRRSSRESQPLAALSAAASRRLRLERIR